MKKIFKITLALLFIAGINIGCENFLEPSVDQNKPTETAVQSIDDLNSVVLGIHNELNTTGLYGRDIVAGPETMSDNAFSNQNSGRFVVQSEWDYTEDSGYPLGLWDGLYESIAAANIAINADIEPSMAVDYAKGQAYALRAFAHMQLLLNFGQQFSGGTLGIPYITTYNEGNLLPAREPVSNVWTKIGEDFTTAASLMDASMDAGSPVFMNTTAVKALQSRYYLFTAEFDNAIAAADAILTGYTPVAAGNLVAAWASGSGPNSIFEMGFTSTNNVGNNNLARIYRDTNYGDVEATQDLYDAYDANDARLGLFSVQGDTIRVNGKYVDELGSDNTRVIRFAEVWLNKAEALARRGNAGDLVDAIDMINTLSTARGSSTIYTVGTQAQVIADVLAERRLELAFEGHRLFDLARHQLDIPFVNVPGRGINFITNGPIPYGNQIFVLPIPQNELDANSSMEQNPFFD
ncbi:RagB/SusD family nutrient uptake outer membrane protein [Gracilimonas sp. Q87]|uniref:RagB/SusD family nutrient uptake outer membrane protein n=1 Tax=Gracilimonas sp. Q87 TaxID=3384766 RepID=UPI003983E602